MAIRSKEYLRNAFRTGAIPTGEDFADLIQTIISQINDKNADAEGVVNTDFKIIDPLGPDRPPIDYPVGASEFYSNYNPSDYAQYIADNPTMAQLEQGQICVRTFRSNGFSYQQVDNVKDGIFNAAYIRLNNSPTDWGVLSPVVGGNVISKPEVTYHEYVPERTSPSGWEYEFDIDVDNYNPETDYLNLHRVGVQNPNRMDPNDYEVMSYTDTHIRIKLLNGARIARDYPAGLWRYKYSTMPRLEATVVDHLNSDSSTDALSANQGRLLNNRTSVVDSELQDHILKQASETDFGHVKVDGTTITANDGTISVPSASLTSRGVVQLYNSITSNSTVAATPSAVNSAIIAHSDVMSSATVLGHVKVDGTTITSADGVISATTATIPDATTTVKGKVQLASSVNNATNLATTPAAVQNAINAHVSIMPTTSIRGHVKPDGVTTSVDGTGTIKARTNLNRVWDSRPITANATTWTVDFSDEEELTDLNNYYFEVYDDGVLVFGNPITHTVNNANKTVTFTPQTPMSRTFTITCIGRGMEFPQ